LVTPTVSETRARDAKKHAGLSAAARAGSPGHPRSGRRALEFGPFCPDLAGETPG